MVAHDLTNLLDESGELTSVTTAGPHSSSSVSVGLKLSQRPACQVIWWFWSGCWSGGKWLSASQSVKKNDDWVCRWETCAEGKSNKSALDEGYMSEPMGDSALKKGVKR